MQTYRHWCIFFLVALLSACGGGPVKRINPPTASIQHLKFQDGNKLNLTIRVQNFSTVPMMFERIEADLEIAGQPIGKLTLNPNLEIPGEFADVINTEVALPPTKTPSPEMPKLKYRLNGRIVTKEPSQSFPFEYASELSAVPGLTGEYR